MIWSSVQISRRYIFRQICKANLPIVITSVSRCVCYLLCKRMLQEQLNFWKIHLHGFQHVQSNGISVQFFSLTTFILKIKFFDILFYLRISRKWWKLEQTLLLPSDTKSCICHRMAPLRVLYITTLTYIFKVTKF